MGENENKAQYPPEYRKSGRSAELCSRIEVDAPPETLWKILMDFKEYPRWNPFIRRIQGIPSVGERLEVSIKPSGAMGLNMRPVLLNVEPASELRWVGHLLIRGLFDGEHVFQIRALEGGRSLFIQREYFRGLLLPLFETMLKNDTSRGFYEMNEAMKARAEQPEPD